MITTFEDFSVELFYEIFGYLALHEQPKLFSNLNSRLSTILAQITSVCVSLGLNGMSMTQTQFYQNYLSEPNISYRLKRLCVSDTLAFGNGTWLASHLHLFVTLRLLKLIDIQRVDMESIVNILPSVSRLVRFEVQFTLGSRSIYSYRGVAEGTYHERIFRSLPQLRSCHLNFVCRTYFMSESIQSDVIVPIHSHFLTISTTLPRLESFSMCSCSLLFLSHIVQFMPQLRELSFHMDTLWLSPDHPLLSGNVRFSDPIAQSLVPNLRRLKVYWSNYLNFLGLNVGVQEPTDWFSREVFYQLTHLSLVAVQLKNEVVQHLLSMLSVQCSYSLDIQRQEPVPMVMEQSMTNNLVLNTIRQLKGRKPVQVELKADFDLYTIRAYTLPQKCRQLDLTTYFSSRTVLAHDWWSKLNTRPIRCFPHVNTMTLNVRSHPGLVENFISDMPSVVSWHQIVHLTVNDTLKLAQFRSIIFNVPHLRKLELSRSFNYIHELNEHERYILIDLLEDTSTCETFRSNGLRELIFSISLETSMGLHIAQMIVERLPQLQIVQIDCFRDYMSAFVHILINRLSKLTFLVANCGPMRGAVNDIDLRKLQTADTRPFQTEVYDAPDSGFIYVWL